MKITNGQIAAVRKGFPHRWIEESGADDPVSAATELLTCSAPCVDVLYAWGPGEPYAISICGVSGAYVVQACEFDPVGVFSSIEEACDSRTEEWAGVDLFATEAEVWAHASAMGFV